jgi:RNA polymerase sigma-70 factor (ECF subfamily)
MGPSEAKDATQAAFERIVRELPRFDASKGSFFGWSSTVARNVCRDRQRRRVLERATFAADGEPLASVAASPRPDPERAAMTQQQAAKLSRALEDLPVPMRQALLLFHVHEHSYEEIAGALDVPMGTVMTWLHRGRSRLRAAVEEP